MALNSSSAAPLHPYYPLGVEIVGYMANEFNTVELLSMFTAGCAVIFSVTYAVLMRTRPNASNSDVSIMMWFVLCGCIHSFFEGYFAYNFRRMGGMQDLFGQLWKEYALSDSRYLTQDAFVLCMETVTAVSLLDAHASSPPLTLLTGLLGPSLLRHRLSDRHRPPAPLLSATNRLARSVLRRCSVLLDLSVRPLHP